VRGFLLFYPSSPAAGIRRWNVLLGWGLLLLGSAARGAEPPADEWVTDRLDRPKEAGSTVGDHPFADLSATSDGSRMVVSWRSDGTNDLSAAVWFSPEGPGHWPARDWSKLAAVPLGPHWQAVLPVVDLDEPIVYFAAIVAADGRTNASAARLCRPRETKLTSPTAPPPTFLEGFEEGSWNWRSTDERAAVQRVAGGRSSGHALLLEIPAGLRSASVATSRVRGIRAGAGGATGFALWMRSDSTNGIVRIETLADAGTDRQVTAIFPEAVSAGPDWTRRFFRFAELKGFPVGALDRVIVEFTGVGPMRLWLDDLELIDF
jgi:hypothetical protein